MGIRKFETTVLTVLLLGLVYMLYLATQWRLEGALFPYVVIPIMMVLVIARVVILLRPARQASEEEEDYETVEVPQDRVSRLRVLRLLGWTGANLAFVYLFGFVIGLALGIVGYLRFESGERLWLATALGLATFAYLYAIFVMLLGRSLTQGYVFGWLG